MYLNILHRTILHKHMGDKFCNRDNEQLEVLRCAIVPIRGGFTTIFVELQCPKCKYISVFKKIIPNGRLFP